MSGPGEPLTAVARACATMVVVQREFWEERWAQNRTAWHQSSVHPALIDRWADAAVQSGSKVFVPLCGASIDMVWLADRGHRVVGSELSEIGVRRFFEAVGLLPTTSSVGDATVFEAGPYELWCGDLFDLPPEAVADVAGVYDRASLVALPAALRWRYGDLMASLVPAQATMFLLTFVYDDTEMDGPPFSVDAAQVDELYSGSFDVELVADEHVLERNGDLASRGLSSLREQLHLLRRRS